MPEGDVGLYKGASGGVTVTSSGAQITLDTIESQNETFSLDGSSVVTVSEACRILYMAGATLEKTTAGAETASLRVGHDPNTGSSSIDSSSWDMKYFPDADGIDRALLASCGIIDCVAGSKLRITAASEGNNLNQVADTAYLQLFRLPSHTPVAILHKTSNQTGVGASYVDITWPTDVVVDSPWTRPSSEQLKWTGGTSRVVLLIGVTINLNTVATQDRCLLGLRVTKNGTNVFFSEVRAFIRGPNGDQYCTMRLSIPVDVVTNDTFVVQTAVLYRANAASAPRVQANRGGICAFEIPTNINTFAAYNSTDQGSDNASLTDIAINTTAAAGAPFSISSPTITINRPRFYLLGHHLFNYRGASGTTDGIVWDSLWRKNGTTDLAYRASSSFSGQAASGFYGSTSNSLIIVKAVNTDTFKLRQAKLGTGADSGAVLVGTAVSYGTLLWGLDLSDLIPLCPRSYGSSITTVTPNRIETAEARSYSQSFSDAQSIRNRLLESRILGESYSTIELEQIAQILLEAIILGESFVSLETIRNKLLESRVTAEAFTDLQSTRQRLVESRIFGEEKDFLEPTRQRILESRVLGESLDSLDLLRALLLESRVLGESSDYLEMIRARLLESRTLGEALTDINLGEIAQLLLESRVFGESFVDTSIVNALRLESRILGESFIDIESIRNRILEIRALGESTDKVEAARLLIVELRNLSESFSSVEATRLFNLESRLWAESINEIQSIRARLVESYLYSEASIKIDVARLFLLESRVFGYEFETADLDAITKILLESRILGEASTVLIAGISLGLETRAYGESVANTQSTRKITTESRVLGESLEYPALNRKRVVESRVLGESFSKDEILRKLNLQTNVLGESQALFSVGLNLGIQAVGSAEAIAQLSIVLKSVVEARSYSEAFTDLLSIYSILNKYKLVLTVVRGAEVIPAIQEQLTLTILRDKEVILVPEEI